MKFDIVMENMGFEIQLRINAYTEINSLAVTLNDRFYRECVFFCSVIFRSENDVLKAIFGVPNADTRIDMNRMSE